MKYYNTALEDQESLINILYKEEIIRIYSNNVETIKSLNKKLGKPTKNYVKSKSSWSGASWDIDFRDVGKISKILQNDIFISKDFEYKKKKITKKCKQNYQVTFDNLV